MGRVPCCEKDNVKRGQWTPEEDNKLSSYIAQHGTRNWRLIPKNAGLQRCGKSCRLRWTNYLRPDLKHGQFTDSEEQTIVKLHAVVGNRWSLIAAQLPGRTDNDVKNYWNTKLKKKLSGMGIDPVTHKPFSHLMAEIATTLAPPQVAHLAEAALGCFKDEMLHLLTKKRPLQDSTTTSNQMIIHHQQQGNINHNANNSYNSIMQHDQDNNNNIDTVERIKLGLSRAITDDHRHQQQQQHHQQQQQQHHNVMMMMMPNGTNHHHHHHFTDDDDFPGSMSGFQYGQTSCINNDDGSPWDQSICSGSTSTTVGVGDQMGHLKLEDNNGDQEENGDQDATPKDDTNKDTNDAATTNNCLFASQTVLWDLPSEDLIV